MGQSRSQSKEEDSEASLVQKVDRSGYQQSLNNCSSVHHAKRSPLKKRSPLRQQLFPRKNAPKIYRDETENINPQYSQDHDLSSQERYDWAEDTSTLRRLNRKQQRGMNLATRHTQSSMGVHNHPRAGEYSK